MKVKAVTYLVIFFLASVLPVWGIELDCGKAKKIALESNPEIRMFREELNKAKFKLIEARANFFPQILAISSLQHAWELPTVIMNNPFYDPIRNPQKKLYFKMGTENSVSLGVNLQVPLYAGGSIRYSYKMALANYDIAQAQLRLKEEEVLSNVISAYYNVLFLISVLRVTEEALEAAEENLRQVRNFYEVGKASEFDLIRAEVQVENYKPRLLSVKNQIKIAEDRLRILLGIKMGEDIVYTDSLTFEESPYLTRSLDELIGYAVKNRADVRILEAQRKVLDIRVKINKSSLLPVLSFGSSLQYQGQRDDFSFASQDFYRASSSSISLNVPIFSGFRNYARIQQSKIDMRKFNEQFESTIRGIKLEVKSAWLSLKEAAQNVRTQSRIVEQSKESLRLANLMYKEGMNTQLDVLNAQVALNQSRMNYQKYLLEYNIALTNLLKALNLLK